jgi:hypothetical protein
MVFEACAWIRGRYARCHPASARSLRHPAPRNLYCGRWIPSVPVYFGLELIHYPGSIEIKPRDVVGVVNAGRKAGAAGAIISWDLMHAPTDGIEALGEQL